MKRCKGFSEIAYSKIRIVPPGAADPAEFFKGRLLILGVEHTKQKGRDDAVETVVGKFSLQYIHFAQIDRCTELIPAPPGAIQHGRTEVNSDNISAVGVERKVSSGADSCIEQGAFQSGKQYPTQGSVAAMFERQVQDVIEPGDAIIGFCLQIVPP